MKIRKMFLITLMFSLLAFLTPHPAWAGDDIIIRIGDIGGESIVPLPGDVDADGRSIDVLRFSWGMSQSGTMHGGGGGGAGKVSIQDISIVKPIGKSSIPLMKAVSDGSQFGTVELTVIRGGVIHMTIIMNNVIITSLSTSISPDDNGIPTENITLNFASVTVHYQPLSPDGSPLGKVITYGWDIAANVKL